MLAKPILSPLLAVPIAAVACALQFFCAGHLMLIEVARAFDGEYSADEIYAYYQRTAIVGAIVGTIIGGGLWTIIRYAMNQLRQTKLDLSRGIWGTCVCALCGALAPMGMALVFRMLQWFSVRTDSIDNFHEDLEYFISEPVIGCAALCASAGWLTFAPAGLNRLLTWLVIVSLVCLEIWGIMGSMGLAPYSRKIEMHVFHPLNLFFLVGPPSMTALFVSAIRIRPGPVESGRIESHVTRNASHLHPGQRKEDVMNLNDNPTIEELREMIRPCNDWAGSHVLWVKKTGEVVLSRIRWDHPSAEFQRAQPDMQMRVETFGAGKEYVGPEAADNQEWMSELFGRLLSEWSNAKGKPNVAYVDISGSRWETKAI